MDPWARGRIEQECARWGAERSLVFVSYEPFATRYERSIGRRFVRSFSGDTCTFTNGNGDRVLHSLAAVGGSTTALSFGHMPGLIVVLVLGPAFAGLFVVSSG